MSDYKSWVLEGKRRGDAREGGILSQGLEGKVVGWLVKGLWKDLYFEKVARFMFILERLAGWSFGLKDHFGMAHLNAVSFFDPFLRYLPVIDLRSIG